MTYLCSCASGRGLDPKPVSKTAFSALLASWSRFIRLRQARHRYFRIASPPDGATSKQSD